MMEILETLLRARNALFATRVDFGDDNGFEDVEEHVPVKYKSRKMMTKTVSEPIG